MFTSETSSVLNFKKQEKEKEKEKEKSLGNKVVPLKQVSSKTSTLFELFQKEEK